MRVLICDHCDGPGQACEGRDYCMCGDRMDHHDMYCGHSPVSMHDYLGTEHRVLDWTPFIYAMVAVVLVSMVGTWCTTGVIRYVMFFTNLTAMALEVLAVITHIQEYRE